MLSTILHLSSAGRRNRRTGKAYPQEQFSGIIQTISFSYLFLHLFKYIVKVASHLSRESLVPTAWSHLETEGNQWVSLKSNDSQTLAAPESPEEQVTIKTSAPPQEVVDWWMLLFLCKVSPYILMYWNLNSPFKICKNKNFPALPICQTKQPQDLSLRKWLNKTVCSHSRKLKNNKN